MYRALLELYRRGKIGYSGIYKAVSDGIITEQQAETIINPKGE